MTEKTTTEVELSAAQLAEQLSVTVQTFNTWKRTASLKTGKSYGRKRGRAVFFTSQEVSEILDHCNSTDDRTAQAPQQVYETFQNEDVEGVQDAGFLALAQNNTALVADVQSVLVMAAQQEAAAIEAMATYLHPVNRTARVLNGLAQRLNGAHRHHDTLSNTLAAAFQQAPALPALPDRIDPAFL